MQKDSLLPIRCERLKELRKKNHYTQECIAKKIGVTTKTYRTWEIGSYIDNNTFFPTIDNEKLEKLSAIYNVSIDYILGRTDYTKVDNDLIGNLLGLSNNAIESLKILKKSEYMEILNFIMNDFATFGAFLSNICLYLDNNFDTPVHYDDHIGIFVESKDITDSPIISTNGEKYISIGQKLDYNVCGHPAYKTLSVPVSILESHAMHCMQQNMDKWKQEYKSQKGSD